MVQAELRSIDFIPRSNRMKGKIPVLLDNSQAPPLAIMETGAQLLYLQEVGDRDHLFSFQDRAEKSQCLQWMFFHHGHGAPSQGCT